MVNSSTTTQSQGGNQLPLEVARLPWSTPRLSVYSVPAVTNEGKLTSTTEGLVSGVFNGGAS